MTFRPAARLRAHAAALPLAAALAAFLTAAPAVAGLHARARHGGRAPAAAPAVRAIRVEPAALTLDNARDARKLLVAVLMADGYWHDATDRASFRPAAALVTRDADGFFHPVKAGRTAMSVTANGCTAGVAVTVRSIASPPISFVRDVMPVLAREGCNAGTCHGAARGKNGFKLSLRGYDPEYDYHALIDDVDGRRFNRAQPADSLMLLKPTQGAAHQGGLVFDEGSRYYKLIYRWIAEGVKSDTATTKRANRIEVLPDAPKLSLPGQTQQLVVIAHYPDGTTRDVTREAVFTSTMPETATVTPDGLVTAARRGEAAVLVRYEGNYAADGLTVLGDRRGYRWAAQPEYNYIDRLIDAKLQRIKATPSPVCTDAEFLRRVYLDIIGVPPTPDAVRAFLADPTPSRAKRSKVIDALLDSPDYVENWTNKWSDLLDCNRKFLGEMGAWKFHDWIREQVAQDRPYDQFVREILTASGSSYEHPAAAYWRVARDPNQATENVTQLFLGIRFSCNKCHDHPFERWTQTQYYQFAANFARIGRKTGAPGGDEDIYDAGTGEVTHLRTGKVMTASYPYAVPGVHRTAEETRRAALADWLTAADNPYFAKSYANRIWSYFLGKGIIDPVDDIRSGNPPVNPELLSALTKDFIAGGFRLKPVIRTICNSRTYQASIKPTRWNADDKTNFSHELPRRLTAEELVDSLARTTGATQSYSGVPVGYRAVQLLDPASAPAGFLDLFGRPPRLSPCECERSTAVSLGQTMHLVNDPLIDNSIDAPDGRIARLMKTNPEPRKIVEELFLAAFCRMPTAYEYTKTLPLFDVTPAAVRGLQTDATAHSKHPTDAEATTQLRTQAARDLMWALINSPAFQFNR